MTALRKLSKSRVVHGFSFFGASFVCILFEDGTDICWAHSRVIEYLNFASGRMPKGVTPQIGPVAAGWVYLRGLTGLNGEGEVVSGKAMARYGQNALEAIRNLKAKIEEVSSGLPEDVTVETACDRSDLIHRAIDTLKRTLIEETVIVALVGGVWLMWWLGYNLSVAVAVGFIALAGVAAETGVVMLIYLDQAWREAQEKSASAGRRAGAAELYAAVMEGAVERVRPKMMTVVAIMAGLLPIMWGTGTGSEVMRRIAAPMVGGMLSSTVLTLIVIPAIYALVKGRRLG